MQVQATAKFIHMSPRKVRLVADLVRGLDVVHAQQQLAMSSKNAAKPVLKVLNSAVANAKNLHQASVEGLRIESILVDEGPTIKRFRPRAHGRSAMIRKRTSHIQVTVGDQQGKDHIIKSEK